MNKRTRLVYGGLCLAWALIIIWQAVEHKRVVRAARAELINRARDISTTLGIVMRSQRRFGGIISKDRLESALNELVRPQQLQAVALLNAAGEVVASAGPPIDLELKGLLPAGQHWAKSNVTLINLVDLGTELAAETDGQHPTIVLPRPERPPFGTNKPPPAPPPGPPPGAPPPEQPAPTNLVQPTNAPPPPAPAHGRGGRPRLGRPFWMSEEEYQAAIQKQGVHSFVLVLSTESMTANIRRDLWLRTVIAALASISVAGLGLAWRNLVRSSELEVRLVRAAELNARLREMNLAAAGLAHETKNPLNIIRGLAQMISKQADTSPEIRAKTREIVDETDRVTAQLNEFINFSRPREIRRSAVALNAVVGEVVRTLEHDLEEKSIRLEIQPDLPTVEADEQQLRQALFNLLLNAIQAVDRQGEIRVTAQKSSGNEVVLNISDNGPGVPPEHRTDIFKPYFTTNAKGTGLGLAVVHQIVLAHGWEIECLHNQPRGAIFRISHIKSVG